MSSVAGVFTPTELLKITQAASETFSDDVMKADVTPYAEAARVITQYQTAKVSALQDPNKDRILRIEWINACNLEMVPLTTECEVDGNEAGSDTKDIEITNDGEIGFKVGTNIFRANSLDTMMVASRQLAAALKTADEEMNQYVISRMEDFAHDADNAFVRGGMTTTDGFTGIPAAQWGPSLMSYFNMVSVKNRLGNVRILSGDLFAETNWLTLMNSANGEGKGAANMMKALPIDNDLFWMDEILGYKGLFLFNPNSVALITKARYPRIPREIGGKVNQTRYSVASPTLKGVFYDVIYEMTCVSDDIKHAWKVIPRYEFLVNPTGCRPGANGILGFKCVD